MKNIATEGKLRALKDFGFVFRILGGAGRKGDNSSYGLLPGYKDGEMYLKIIPYNPSILLERRYEEEFAEDPKGILERKILEQTGIRLSEYHEIGEQIAKNNKIQVKSERHIKHVFLIDTYDDSNERGEPTSDKRLDPPLWVELELLKKYIFPGHLWMINLLEEKVLAPRLKEN